MPKLEGLLETSLYVREMRPSVAFFKNVLGLVAMLQSEQVTAFDAGRNRTLLVLLRGASVKNVPENDYIIPGHDGRGPSHMAFAITEDSYDEWKTHILKRGVTIRSEINWRQGGRSLYFNDPDGHVLQLATSGLWPNYQPR